MHAKTWQPPPPTTTTTTAFVTFSLGHPTATTELHGALPGWLAGMIDVLSCPSHDHIPQIEANSFFCIVLSLS